MLLILKLSLDVVRVVLVGLDGIIVYIVFLFYVFIVVARLFVWLSLST